MHVKLFIDTRAESKRCKVYGTEVVSFLILGLISPSSSIEAETLAFTWNASRLGRWFHSVKGDECGFVFHWLNSRKPWYSFAHEGTFPLAVAVMLVAAFIFLLAHPSII
ncbi:hypothetical protein AKJ16_DCAP26261 [Drosera capensis]